MNRLITALLLLSAVAMLAQSPPVANRARFTFEQRWPAVDPQWFELVLQSDGTAKYRSLPHQDAGSASGDRAPEPFELSFTPSPRLLQRTFALAPGLLRFRGTLDKNKVAFTGTKTLRYDDGAGVSSVISYNYSTSPELTGLTSLMQGISESIELSETLKVQLRFDKLALDATLRAAEETAEVRAFQEPQLLEPILQQIANDPAVMNIARQRARHLLQSAASIAEKR
jgi:hypothetical protein